MFRISSHLHRNKQSGILYFRLTVPQPLRHILRKREIKKSLGTGQRSKALPIAQLLYCKYFMLFHKFEGGSLSEEQEDYRQVLEELEAMGDGKGALHKTTVKVNGKPITIERDDPLEEAMIAAQLAGLSVPAPGKNATSSKTEEKAKSLATMIKAFVAEKKLTDGWTAKTIDENLAIFQLLKEVLKNPSVDTIGIKQATDFKNVLLRLPPNRTKGANAGMSVQELLKMKHSQTMSVATVNKYLRRISSLFHWGKRHGYVHENPFEGLGLKEHRMPFMQRERFYSHELKALLDPAHHNQAKLKHSYCYWLPWLGLYTGARLEELCQLHLSDVRQESGVWVIDINGRDEKRLKTPAAERLVPIHIQLVQLGFLERVSELQGKGEKRLFPELRQTRDGYGQTASKWFARYRERFKIHKQFHSLRHTFVDELRQKGADHKKIAALVGHVDESETGGRYGKPFLPEVLQPVVEMLSFDV